jgi:hypothetical protein
MSTTVKTITGLGTAPMHPGDWIEYDHRTRQIDHRDGTLVYFTDGSRIRVL